MKWAPRVLLCVNGHLESFGYMSSDIGKEVRVTTNGGDRLSFRITDIEPHGIGYRSGFVPYENMSRLEVRQPGENEETTRIILGILGIAAVIALVNSADSVRVCSPSPCPQPDG